MQEHANKFEAAISQWRCANDTRYTEHKSVLLLAMVCIQSDEYKSGAKAVEKALKHLGSADELALSVFSLNHQIRMFRGTKLLRATSFPITSEFHEANAKTYAGLQAIFDALGIELEQYEANAILDELQCRSEMVIMSHMIFN
ncbi:hypothetical protein LMH73_008780 [Vibrio splendidus]|nr:hypothetical protein [Vibrio splendidus]MCC4879438.1 hypothetical protein [Vibrio splendidus]